MKKNKICRSIKIKLVDIFFLLFFGKKVKSPNRTWEKNKKPKLLYINNKIFPSNNYLIRV